MNQKGFAPIVLLVGALIVAGLAGTATYYNQRSNQVLKNLATSLKVFSPSSSSTETSRSQQIKVDSSTVSKEDNTVVIHHTFHLAGDQSIVYSIALPKQGGKVTGKVTGSCNGDISGTLGQPDKSNQSKLQGKVGGECQLTVLPIKTALAATFEGLVYFNDSKININYDVTNPLSYQGNLDILFSQNYPLSPAPTSTESNTPYTISLSTTKVEIIGTYTVPDNNSTSYNIKLARQGGPITGTTSGMCQADIIGQVGNIDSKGLRPISGTIRGSCRPIVQNNFNTEINGTFWGSLDDKKGIISIIHNGIFDKNSNSSFTVTYNP